LITSSQQFVSPISIASRHPIFEFFVVFSNSGADEVCLAIVYKVYQKFDLNGHFVYNFIDDPINIVYSRLVQTEYGHSYFWSFDAGSEEFFFADFLNRSNIANHGFHPIKLGIIGLVLTFYRLVPIVRL